MPCTSADLPSSSRPSLARALAIWRAAIVVLLVGAAPQVTRAQVRVLQPGDTALRTDRIRAQIDTFVVLFTPKGGSEFVSQTVTRTVQRLRVDGIGVLRLVEHHAGIGRSGTDTVDVAAGTLDLRRLLSTSSDSSGRTVVDADLRVVNGRLQGRTNAGTGVDRPVDLDMSRLFTDMTAEAFVAALPVSESSFVRTLVLRVFDLRTRYIDFVTEGSEQLLTAAGPVDCFRVRAGGGPVLWIARDDGHLVRTQWQLPDGTVAWKLPKQDLGYRTPALVDGAREPGVSPVRASGRSEGEGPPRSLDPRAGP